MDALPEDIRARINFLTMYEDGAIRYAPPYNVPIQQHYLWHRVVLVTWWRNVFPAARSAGDHLFVRTERATERAGFRVSLGGRVVCVNGGTRYLDGTLRITEYGGVLYARVVRPPRFIRDA